MMQEMSSLFGEIPMTTRVTELFTVIFRSDAAEEPHQGLLNDRRNPQSPNSSS